MMQITWYGHAAFLLEDDTATVRIVLDPYRAPDVGTYLPIDDTADIVAISHINAKYHSHVEGVQGKGGQAPQLVDGLALLEQPQPLSVGNADFTATRVWENDKREEPIAMVGVTLDGVRVLHMGDCGHALSPEEVANCGKVDILLALAGGAPTLSLPDLATFIHDLKPRVVIPMHFGNDKINLNLQPLSELLALLPNLPQRYFDSPTIPVSSENLPTTTEVWILPPAR
jgi:L-ascorbate metabolism protein UlaG (beta-lactamase superfamily)